MNTTLYSELLSRYREITENPLGIPQPRGRLDPSTADILFWAEVEEYYSDEIAEDLEAWLTL